MAPDRRQPRPSSVPRRPVSEGHWPSPGSSGPRRGLRGLRNSGFPRAAPTPSARRHARRHARRQRRTGRMASASTQPPVPSPCGPFRLSLRRMPGTGALAGRRTWTNARIIRPPLGRGATDRPSVDTSVSTEPRRRSGTGHLKSPQKPVFKIHNVRFRIDRYTTTKASLCRCAGRASALQATSPERCSEQDGTPPENPSGIGCHQVLPKGAMPPPEPIPEWPPGHHSGPVISPVETVSRLHSSRP